MPPKTVPGVIYARYSDDSQKEESIEQQVIECEEYAAANNIKVIRVYADKAITGRTDKRPQFQRMMKDAESREFRVVIAYKSSRIARKMIHALSYEAKLDALGINTVYAKEEFGDTAAGRFALRTMMNVNQFYSENMAEDILRGLMNNAKECKVNCKPAFGYKKGEDGKYAIDEPCADIVREVYRRTLAGDSFVSIRESINGRGFRTKHGNKFNKSSFEKMLKNDIYIGTYRYNGIVIEDGVPPILEKEVFYAMQKHLTSKKKPHGRQRENGEYLLTGKLCCGLCGAFMVGISGTSRTGKLHYYYSCNKHREEGCAKKNVNRDWLEQLIAEMTQDFIGRDDVIEWIADSAVAFQKEAARSSEITSLEDELAENRKALRNIMKAIEQGIFNDTTKARMQELETENADIERTLSIAKAMNRPREREHIADALRSLRDGSPGSREYRRKLINTFVKSVHLWDDRIEIHYYYEGEGNTHTFTFESEPCGSKAAQGSLNSTMVEHSGLYTNQPGYSLSISGAVVYVALNSFVLHCPINNN